MILPQYRKDIDSLRAVAILLVLGFHLVPDQIKGGFVGVDIFFVISGFLISTIIFRNLENNTFSFLEFYSRRIRRIFPALILVLAAVYAWGWFILLGPEFKELGLHICGGAGFVANLVLLREAGYFDAAESTKPLLHLWTLGIEEQFYIIFPLVMWIAKKIRLNLLIVTIAVGVVSFIMNIRETNPNAAFYLPQTRFWELMIGVALAWIMLKRGKDHPNLQNVCSTAGAFFIITGVFFITKDARFLGWLSLLPTLGTALIISAGPKAWLNRTFLSNRMLVWLGLISYPLYLWHWPLISFTQIMIGQAIPVPIRLVIGLVSVILAWLTYRFIEMPIRQKKQNKVIVKVLVVLMIVIGLMGYQAFQSNGLMSRLPKELQEWLDWGSFARVGTCTLNTGPKDTVFPDFCFEKTRPLVALWGDSHAASLYPGLKALQDKAGFGIIQVNTAGCPPVFGMHGERKNCDQINDSTFKKLVELRPDTLIVHSAWVLPAFGDLNNETLFKSKVSDTMALVRKELPGTRIILIGPFPRWQSPPGDRILAAWRSKMHHWKVAPVKFDIPVDILYKTDADLKDIALKNGIDYVSPDDILCNKGNCLLKVGERPYDLITFDGQHRSRTGAIFFMDKIKGKIIGTP